MLFGAILVVLTIHTIAEIYRDYRQYKRERKETGRITERLIPSVTSLVTNEQRFYADRTPGVGFVVMPESDHDIAREKVLERNAQLGTTTHLEDLE